MDIERIRTGLIVAGGTITAIWLSLEMAVQVLIVLVVLDMFSALVAAGRKGAISSEAFWDGLTRKKILMGAIVAAAYIAQPILAGLPAGSWVAGAYCVAEFLSIIENAALAGVWVPKILRQALEKLTEQADGDVEPATVPHGLSRRE